MKRNSRLSVALHALVHLAARGEQVMTSTELADCMQTNPVVVRRIMGELREANLCCSTNGHGGGWRLCRPAEDISLYDVYAALGETLLIRAEPDAGDAACHIVSSVNAVMGEFISDAEAMLAARLKRMSIASMVTGSHGIPQPY
jgi:Rrf2 family protein